MGFRNRKAFIVVTGEVGAGKTTLTDHLWSQLDRNTYIIARVVTTQVSGDDLLRLAMANFGLGDIPGTDKSTLLRRFEHMVRDQRKQGRRCLLVIDEVQNLSLAAMEELRMLSNITVDGKASVQTILLGQPQFRPILASQGLGAASPARAGFLSSRPADRSRNPPLYRASAADRGLARRSGLGGSAAFSAVHRHTGGIPRRINTLCSRVLLFGALEETHTITGGMVEATARGTGQ